MPEEASRLLRELEGVLYSNGYVVSTHEEDGKKVLVVEDPKKNTSINLVVSPHKR